MKIATFAAAAVLLVSTAAFAQYPESNGQIQTRKYDQQQRIHQGVASGELTPHEAHHLERREHALNHEERNMRAANGGYLTRRNRRVLHGQQNRDSRRIYRQKHDGQVY
ncbi:hypothetical protein [Terriglobus sp.]|uniref:hypothetical protein n=1 Tax=Terriglobus sp. TaxID=1889013 RepID=UPI003B009A19